VSPRARALSESPSTVVRKLGRAATRRYALRQVLLAEITDARLAIYERAGHALHWEEPERFAADVAAFAESVVGLSRPRGVESVGYGNGG